jgi:hypothetical protein
MSLIVRKDEKFGIDHFEVYEITDSEDKYLNHEYCVNRRTREITYSSQYKFYYRLKCIIPMDMNDPSGTIDRFMRLMVLK